MHRPFAPVPLWLDVSKGVEPETEFNFNVKRMGTNLFERAGGFQLLSFESLYRLGLSDRQVVELTALILLICSKGKRGIKVPMTERAVALWKAAHPGESPCWCRDGFRFYWVFSSIQEFFEAWITLHLLPVEKFWLGDNTWLFPFLEEQHVPFTLFQQLASKLRILFAQHVLEVPSSGTWDKDSIRACQTFQEAQQWVQMPWKIGLLDGFTYRALACHWRAKKGIKAFPG